MISPERHGVQCNITSYKFHKTIEAQHLVVYWRWQSLEVRWDFEGDSDSQIWVSETYKKTYDCRCNGKCTSTPRPTYAPTGSTPSPTPHPTGPSRAPHAHPTPKPTNPTNPPSTSPTNSPTEPTLTPSTNTGDPITMNQRYDILRMCGYMALLSLHIYTYTLQKIVGILRGLR